MLKVPVLLSVGANDLFRSPGSRQETLRAPFAVAERILARVESIVQEVHRINPKARVLILGGYNPVPWHEYSDLIDGYLGLWDQTLTGRFAGDELVTIVRMSDIVTRERLSRFDSFHPGGKAYDLAARRIAQILVQG